MVQKYHNYCYFVFNLVHKNQLNNGILMALNSNNEKCQEHVQSDIFQIKVAFFAIQVIYTSDVHNNGFIVRAISQPIFQVTQRTNCQHDRGTHLQSLVLSPLFLIIQLKFFVTSHVSEAALRRTALRQCAPCRAIFQSGRLCMPMTGEKMKKGRRKKLYEEAAAASGTVVDLLTSKCPRLHQRRSSISTLWKIALSCVRSAANIRVKHITGILRERKTKHREANVSATSHYAGKNHDAE